MSPSSENPANSDWLERYHDYRFGLNGAPRDIAKAGICFAIGKGCTKNEPAAERWLRKAASVEGECPLGDSYLRVGMHYALGNEVEQDAAEAEKWFHKAAAIGYMSLTETYMSVSRAYAEGDRVEPNSEQAERWRRKASV